MTDTAHNQDDSKTGVKPLSFTRPGQARVWALNVVIWLAAAIGIQWIRTLPETTGLGVSVSWIWLGLGFYAAELMVVHLQFRQDAHTFSQSEVPMTLGLLMSNPAALLLGQMVGSLVALGVHRRQRPVKLVLNLGQLVLQTVAAVAVFRAIAGAVVAFDMRTVGALVLSMLAALFVGHAAVLGAIRASGGTESMTETARVFTVSSIGTVGTTLLGIVATMALTVNSSVVWVGFVPILLVFVAYRAYVSQVQDKDRVEALFEAATTLHRTPQIDRAVEAVASQLLDLIKAETAAVVLFPTEDDPSAYLAVVDTDGTRRRMSRTDLTPPVLELSFNEESRILDENEEQAVLDLLPWIEVRQVLADILTVDDDPVGLLLGVNRLGDVSDFESGDLRVLTTLGSQLSTTLENSRLTDNVSELRVLKRQLEALIESKDQLIASVSHELRTPLTSVVGMSALVRDIASEALDSDSTEMLNLIVEQGTEMSNIIDDLLAHARAEAGTLSIHPERFDLVEEIEIIASSHDLEAPVTEGGLWVLADPLRVRQIVRNLITNARRYGGDNVWLAYGIRSDRVSVSVVDDGSGVEPGSEASIFEPYKSAHSPAGQPGSVGLGLALSQSMAHMMSGDVTYKRRDGETWFTLELPAVKSPATAVADDVVVDDGVAAVHDIEVERARRQA